jgi:cobalt-zinc-cadmium efflux system outer membrane protein
LITFILFALGLGAPASSARPILTLDAAWAQALQSNQSLVAAQLLVPEATVLQTAAALWPNPEVEYSVANLVLGAGNDQERDLHPTFFEQSIQQVAVRQVLDVWGKRRAHTAVAKVGVEAARWRLADALREIYHAVTTAYVAVVREQEECALAQDSRRRYDQTVALTRKRLEAGDIAASELRIIELEGLRYANAAAEAEMELRVAREDLAQLLAWPATAPLPMAQDIVPQAAFVPIAAGEDLVQAALAARPDYQAAQAAYRQTELQQVAAGRDAWADPAVQVGYARSKFQISGDNPHALALAVALPLPLFDRNQAGRAEAALATRRAAAELALLQRDIAHAIGTVMARTAKAQAVLTRYESGGMRAQAETVLSVAERSYRSGAISYLEMLEAERTFIEIEAHRIATRYDLWQAYLDMNHATAKGAP